MFLLYFARRKWEEYKLKILIIVLAALSFVWSLRSIVSCTVWKHKDLSSNLVEKYEFIYIYIFKSIVWFR